MSKGHRCPRKPKIKLRDKGGWLNTGDSIKVAFTAHGPIPFSAVPDMIRRQLKQRGDIK